MVLFRNNLSENMTYTFSSYKKMQTGDNAPDFNLPGTDGKEHSLKDYKDAKAVLIVFMCNHCPYVVPKIPKLVELDRKYREKGLRIVGINANDAENYPEDSPEQMKTFVKEEGIEFDYLFDESQEVPKEYGAECTPDPFLLDAELKLAYHGRIDDAHGKPHTEAKTNELEQAIEQLLKGEKISVENLPSGGCNIKWK